MSRSLLVLLCCALSVTIALGAETRGPYLQIGTPGSVIVRWSSDASGVGRVRFGTSVDELDRTIDGEEATMDHEIRLFGLDPDRRYFYSVGLTGDDPVAGDPDLSFVTAPVRGTVKATRIWVVGDSGTADANSRAVRDAYDAHPGSDRTDVWLMLGDTAYNTGKNSEYQRAVFDTYPDRLRTTVLWPAIGNHDRFDGVAGTYPYFDVFTLPTRGEAGGRPSFSEAYYSFDYANIHFICLDSYQSDRSAGGPMLTWLEEDLMLTDADWVIAFWHHPPYTRGSHNSDSSFDSAGRMRDMRQNALPILDAYGVDLVLSGHSHSYERSAMLDQHYGLSGTLQDFMVLDDGIDGVYGKPSPGSAPHEGAVYIVAGSSGKTGGGALNHRAMVVSLRRLGSLVLDVRANVMSAAFLRETGTVDDSFTIVKGGAAGGFDTPDCLDCPICTPPGQPCDDDADCCSNDCTGPPAGKTCEPVR